MVDNTHQSVVTEPDTATQVADEGADAQDDFAALLSEYDGVQSQRVAEPDKDEGPPPLEQRVLELEREKLARMEQELITETRGAIDNAVAKIKPLLGALPVNFPDKWIRGALAETAQEDPRFMAAFESRMENPDKWERIVVALGRQFQKELGDIPDRGATSDRAAVTAAVRASTTQAAEPDATNWATMSNKDFDQAVHALARR